jgi:hypothetical protein
MTFGWINWCVLAAFVLGTTWLGHLLKGKATGLEGFFLGGRSLPWWAVSGSIMATQITRIDELWIYPITCLVFLAVAMATGGRKSPTVSPS